MPITLKQDDTFPEVEFLLEDAAGPVNLSTADTITLTCKFGLEVVTLTGTADADQSGVRKGYGTAPLAAGDMAVVGEYDVEAKVVWSVGQEQRFPNTGYESLTVEAKLA